MKVEKKLVGDVWVMQLGGRLDLGEISVLDQVVRDLIQNGGRKFVMVMRDVTDISSTGVGRILQLHRELELDGGRLALADLSQVVEYVLELARLDDIFRTYPNQDAALASFGG